MDLFMNDNNDQDYYVEYESGDEGRNWSSGDDENEYNHELEDSTESFENELNLIRENVERKRSLNNDEDFEMLEVQNNKGAARDGKPDKSGGDNDFLYDPEMDDDDAKWIKRERQKYIPKKSQEYQTDNDNTSVKTDPSSSANIRSDAILNCPACLITVCIDCQRHEAYKTQYRAMFTMHCDIDRSQLLRYEKKRKGKKKKIQDAPGKLVPVDDDNDKDAEIFNPVKCSECGTVIAVYDSEEVYHFFNVLASQA